MVSRKNVFIRDKVKYWSHVGNIQRQASCTKYEQYILAFTVHSIGNEGY